MIEDLLRPAGAEGARSRHRSRQFELADDLPDIVADKRALKQILLNLLSNAIKFTERGGKVTVSARVEGGRSCARGRATPASASADRSDAHRRSVLPGA